MEGYCSLIIKGDELEFDEIEKNLGLEASKKFQKGKINSNIIGKIEFDLIRFDERLIENQTLNETLKHLLKKIMEREQFIKLMHKKYDIVLNCYIQSDYAQMRFEISPDVLAKICQLGIKLEFSILSWGGVDKD